MQRQVILVLCCSGPTNGAEVVAATLQDIARKRTHCQASTSAVNSSAQGLADLAHSSGGGSEGGGPGQPKRAGSVRLRDAIVWGYMMQRHDSRTKVLPHPVILHLPVRFGNVGSCTYLCLCTLPCLELYSYMLVARGMLVAQLHPLM